ncbi:MAG: hypothetical protein VX938_13630, partial [Myxococcota bacterium]|nr:hypothetical protein [Myxococcota bacterium]
MNIDKDRILVTAGPANKRTLAVTLAHPDAGDGEVLAGAKLVLRAEPGPAPQWAMKELKRRIEDSGVVLGWLKPTKEEAPEVKGQPTEALQEPLWTVDSVRTALSGAAHRISTGDQEAAKDLLGNLPDRLDSEASLEVAVLWQLVGDKTRAREILNSAGVLEPPLSVAAAVILEDQATVTRALETLEAEKSCGHMVVAALHERLGNRSEVVNTAARIRELDPTCREAWEMEVHGLVYEARIPVALERGEEALKRFPEDVRMLRAVASVHQANGDLTGAIPLLERA